MDHPPREIKETLFTRHNQTVLPLLAITRKDSLQAIHTSFVNTAIDNRVINNRLTPINDQETYLTRRHRVTLSHLRFGHCKLLNSGMVQHDVPHLVNCTSHTKQTDPLTEQHIKYKDTTSHSPLLRSKRQ